MKNEDIEKRDAEIHVLQDVNSDLLWLVAQGDYSDPKEELIIRAAKEGKTTEESAQQLIESCEQKIDTLQEHAERRLKESTELHQYLKSLVSALKASLKLQFHYAKLLNMHDGDERLVLDIDRQMVDKWMKWMEEQSESISQSEQVANCPNAVAMQLRDAADKGVKIVEVCGHTDTCECCWCALRDTLKAHVAAFDAALK